MTLTWPQINDLAAALNAAHPDIDRLSLTSAECVALIESVTGQTPFMMSDEEAAAVKWQWMKLADASPLLAHAGEHR